MVLLFLWFLVVVVAPPPVPQRNTTKRSVSNPSTVAATLQPGLPGISSLKTPPPPKRNQSLRRKSPSPDGEFVLNMRELREEEVRMKY